MLFIEAPAFTRLLPSHLTDDEYPRLQIQEHQELEEI